MKILIVEDERKTGDYLSQGLIEAGFVTDLARTGGRVPRRGVGSEGHRWQLV